MKELTVDATVENIGKVTDFVDGQLELYDCPMKAQTQINIAIDELFGNIAHYAYNPDVGPVTEASPMTRLQRRIRTLRFPQRSAGSAGSASIW